MRMRGRSKRPSTSTTSYSSSDEEIIIKKGPWKADEDEVLLKHVNKYGPRDWSSLLSKGLLYRTGKSCRLRWVNKLRPNLKNGCKFSCDEERIVIELQSQLGNKWAKIATYLPGRTDNDVKNFWSSRQKRLARLLHNSQQQNPKSKSYKTSTDLDSLLSQAPNRDPVVAETSSKAESSNSYTASALEIVPLDMIEPINAIGPPPSTNTGLDLMIIPVDQENRMEFSILQQQNLPFLDIEEELIGNIDLDFMGVFGGEDPVTSGAIIGHDDDNQRLMHISSEMANYLGPIEATSFGDQQLGGEMKANDSVLDQNPLSPDRFFDDLPSDIFDQMDQLPSPPSDW